jgi:hypothetical protein
VPDSFFVMVGRKSAGSTPKSAENRRLGGSCPGPPFRGFAESAATLDRIRYDTKLG